MFICRVQKQQRQHCTAADEEVGGSKTVLFSTKNLAFPRAGVQDGCSTVERLTQFDLICTDNAPDPPWKGRELFWTMKGSRERATVLDSLE